ncbi:hypothetical protein [Cellulomonas persica]|uniref:Uncharacterized protein n=1 Tax=Cellulomonas persica TaxID=76861 RepID=A0A510UVB4_9CELL|nr:hypothetical protein [Cellulomonas persica]GEK18624.1 hypothetical protein CPE01_23570 [Cellulomonas persica]
MDPRTHDPAQLVETAARALFERRAEHSGLRFDALPVWALWVRESYLEDARAVLEAVGLVPGPQRATGDRYERLADAALRTSSRLPVGRAGRVPAQRAPIGVDDRVIDRMSSPRTEELEALLLEPADVAALGFSGVESSLDWKPPVSSWNPPSSAY